MCDHVAVAKRMARILATIMIMGLLGCGAPGADPESTATGWLRSLDKAQYAEACDLMVDTDDTPLVAKGPDRAEACTRGLSRLLEQAAQGSTADWLASARTVRIEGDTAVVEFTDVEGRMTVLRVDDQWYVADPGIGVVTFR